jgi:Zn-dependent protease
MNLFIALVAGLTLKVLISGGSIDQALQTGLFSVVAINVSLAFFNLIPIPPFDGMSILQSLFPRLQINQRFIYSPLYMILAIVIGSVLYSAFIPHIFSVLTAWFS